ncbi:site-specific integrase [Saccharopolyspora pogona]|uniref:hypothetical protein n=1 Tax=Saccharopolyspora pogona TaxID=333966 RepID=UPI001684B41B|nr:hypothetical protein [Saccharopolyspora pogona]
MTIAESTKRVVFDHVPAILAAAVEDERIGRNPCQSKSVTPPKRTREPVTAWTHAQVAAKRANIAERYRPLITLGAGLGLRAGEVYGLSPDDVDWLRGNITIRRQVKIVGNRRVFAPPKGGKVRSVPLPASVRDDLAAYLANKVPRRRSRSRGANHAARRPRSRWWSRTTAGELCTGPVRLGRRHERSVRSVHPM